MKNQYSKFVKYLEKQDNVYFQRSGSSVYLSDGYTALQVPAIVYSNLIRPLSGIFPDVTNDCRGVKRNSDAMIKITDEGMNIAEVVKKIATDKTIAETPLFAELSTRGRKKTEMARIFLADNEIIAVRAQFLELFSECPVTGVWQSSGQRRAPIVQKNEEYAISVCPVLLNDETQAFLQKLENN